MVHISATELTEGKMFYSLMKSCSPLIWPSLFWRSVSGKVPILLPGVVFLLMILAACKNEKNTETSRILIAGKEIPFSEKEKDRLFIAHRGVHFNHTIAGENSLEAVRLAKRAGFELIETDVRWTLDSILIVMHDKTLNRTCLNSDGTEILNEVEVADVTLEKLKSDFILKANEKINNTTVPTLKEFLIECKNCGIVPFIEPKLNDVPDKYYRTIISEADEVMGRNNYVITSNNSANKIIRDMGFKDIILMGVLYLSTFEEIENLGNVIMAISATQFQSKEYSDNVIRAKLSGIPTESHANTFEKFALINDNGIDIISTDILAPDLNDKSELLNLPAKSWYNNFNYNGSMINGTIVLSQDETISLKTELPEIYFGGIFIEIELSGNCEVIFANKKFLINNPEMKVNKHQVMIHSSIPQFSLTAKDKCIIKNIDLKLVTF